MGWRQRRTETGIMNKRHCLLAYNITNHIVSYLRINTELAILILIFLLLTNKRIDLDSEAFSEHNETKGTAYDSICITTYIRFTR